MAQKHIVAQKHINRYLIFSEIARGGMATVYSAHDPNFDRNVAVKVLPREFLHDQTFRARFKREAKAVARLEHAAIVPVYDFGEEDGQLYLVMRYMAGGSLADCIEQGPMPLADVVHIVGRLAPALDKAHSMGIIHRDLKPPNVLFDEDGEAYITDFGIARLAAATAELTASNAIVGTPAYMSPEQARDSGEIDGRSDIYSLGVIIFQMLTARLPYQARSSVGYLTAHVTEPVPNILDFAPNLTPGIQLIIERAMAKDPKDRYRLATDLASDLEMVAQASPAPENSKPPQPGLDPFIASSRGPTRPRPHLVQPYDPVSRSPVAPGVGPIRTAPYRWGNTAWGWLAGGALAIVGGAIILLTLSMSAAAPMTPEPGTTPPLSIIGLPSKTVPKMSIETMAPTVTATPTFAVTQASSQTRPLAATTQPLTYSPISMPTLTCTPTQVPTITDMPTRLPTSTPMPTLPPTLTYTAQVGIGDVNEDGEVNATDAYLVMRYYNGQPVSIFNSDVADVNYDCIINPTDAFLISRYSTGLISSLPYYLPPGTQLAGTESCGSGCGDVNSSGTVDPVDALLVERYANAMTTSNFNYLVADVNEDGFINNADSTLILKHYVGEIDALPWHETPTQ